MPLQRCGRNGWRWGQLGKCYRGRKARAMAVQQAKAILASEFTENVSIPTRPNPLLADPTRTATLRRQFETDLHRRFLEVKSDLRNLVLKEDAFGLTENYNPNQSGIEEGEWIIDKVQLTENTRWKFRTNADKLKLFQSYLSTLLKTKLLDSEDYWSRYVEEGYRKGTGRVFDDFKAKRWGPGEGKFYEGTRAEFIDSAFNSPERVQKVKLLASRVYSDLQGVSDAMGTQLSRVITDGFVQGKNANDIAKDIAKEVDGIELKRAKVIARTEIIRAHAEGQLDALEEMGIEEIGVMVEWEITADQRTCPLCRDLEGIVLKVKEARGLIPRHPQCRCCFIPANLGESISSQKRTKSAIEKAILRSIKDEMPKRKKSVAQQRKNSRWVGAGRHIAKKRPKSLV